MLVVRTLEYRHASVVRTGLHGCHNDSRHMSPVLVLDFEVLADRGYELRSNQHHLLRVVEYYDLSGLR